MQLVPNDNYIVRWIGRGTVLRILSTCMSSTLLCVGLLLQCAAAEKQSEIQRVSLLEPGGTWKITEFRCEEGAVPENAQLSLHPTTEVTDTAVNLMEHVHLRLYAGLGPAVEVRPLRMLETARYLSEGIQLKLEAETEDVNVNVNVNVNASQNSFTLQRTCANETNMVQHPLHSTPLCMQVVQAFGSYELMRHLLGVRITQDEFVRGNIHMTLTDACTVTVSDISLKLLPPKTLASVHIMSLYIGFTQNDVALFLTEVEDGFIDVLRRTSLFPQFTSPEGSHVLNDEQHTSHLWLSELKKLIEAIEKPATESQANFEFLTLKRESRPRNYDQVVETVSEKEGQPAVSFEFAHDGTSYMMHFARTRGHVFFQNVPIAVISPDLDPTRNHASTVAYPVIGGIPFFVDHGKYLYRRIVLFKVLWSLDRKQKLKKDCSSTHVMFLMKLFCDQNTLIQVFLVTLTMTELLVRRSQNRMVAKETEAYDYFPYLNLFDVSVRVNVAFISFMYSGRCSTLMALRDFEIWLFDTRSALWKEHPLWSSQALSFDSSKYDLETVIEERATSHTQTKPHTWSTKISWIFYMLGISSFFCVLIFVVLLSVFTSTRTRRAESHLLRLRSEKMIN